MSVYGRRPLRMSAAEESRLERPARPSTVDEIGAFVGPEDRARPRMLAAQDAYDVTELGAAKIAWPLDGGKDGGGSDL